VGLSCHRCLFVVKMLSVKSGHVDFLVMVALNLAWAGFILALRSLWRFSTFKQGPTLLLTNFMISSFTRDNNCPPSIFCWLNASASVPHSFISRKVDTSSMDQLVGFKPPPELPPAEPAGAAWPAESTSRGITLTGMVSGGGFATLGGGGGGVFGSAT